MRRSESGCQACPPGRCSAQCRRTRIITAVTAAVPDVPVTVLAEVVDAVLINPAIGRFLASALTADPAALLTGAPPVIGKLIGELRARGADLPDPTCSRCGRTGKPLTMSPSGGVCAPLPTTATRGALHHMWSSQTDRRPRRTGSAVLRPVRRSTATALREVRSDQADRPPRPRRDPRHLRRLLPDARRGLQPVPATPAMFLRGRTGTDLHRLRSTGHSGLCALRSGPPTGSPVAGRAGLRPLLHRGAPPPR